MRALLVDDHHIVVEALKTALGATRLFERIDSATSLGAARGMLEKDADYQLAVLDLHLGDAEGRETVEALRESFPDIPVMVFSGDTAMESITMAFELGASAYVPKSSPIAVVIAAIKMVLAGGTYIPPDAMSSLAAPRPPARGSVDASPAELRLSGRQEQVFKLLLQGLPNKVIASRLDMAEGTAKSHLNSIFRSLGVRTRVEAILKARQLGLV
jgi:DNA-binding NarL/FixJ family response regulator